VGLHSARPASVFGELPPWDAKTTTWRKPYWCSQEHRSETRLDRILSLTLKVPTKSRCSAELATGTTGGYQRIA
jgi:hypothetical protein